MGSCVTNINPLMFKVKKFIRPSFICTWNVMKTKETATLKRKKRNKRVNPQGLLTQFKSLTSDDIFYANFHTFCDVFIRLLWLADQPQAQESTTAIHHHRSCLKACNHSMKGLVYKGTSFWVLVYSSHLLK